MTTDPATIPDRLCTLITEHLSCADRFRWDADLRRDLGADSLDSVELAAAIEQEFGVPVPDDADWVTAGDVLETVRGLA